MFEYAQSVKTCLVNKMEEERRERVGVVVLGDIGRSPRMQYHALSFLDEKYDVDIVAYSGSEPLKQLHSHKNVRFKYLLKCPEFKKYLPTILAYFVKVVWQVLTLCIALLRIRIPDFLLVQNPPAIPVLFIAYFYCKVFRSKLIVDWHNYAHSLLALSLHPEHILVKMSKRIEFYFGRKAYGNLCVTKAMKEDLKENHNIKAVTLYDRPHDFFKAPSIQEKHKLFLELGLEYEIFVKDCKPGETVFTEIIGESTVALKDSRPGLLISSTSWTEDENFYTLLKALEEYEKVKATSNLPDLICAISGKGPLKDFYKQIIASRKWSHVHIITPWLQPEDYPIFIGSADLGVCLHTSSSGLDLPMKVADMFGCLVPVCAKNFNCISELVKHGENGFIFDTEDELFSQIKNWFTGFPHSSEHLHRSFKENLKNSTSLRWHDNWYFYVMPLL